MKLQKKLLIVLLCILSLGTIFAAADYSGQSPDAIVQVSANDSSLVAASSVSIGKYALQNYGKTFNAGLFHGSGLFVPEGGPLPITVTGYGTGLDGDAVYAYVPIVADSPVSFSLGTTGVEAFSFSTGGPFLTMELTIPPNRVFPSFRLAALSSNGKTYTFTSAGGIAVKALEGSIVRVTITLLYEPSWSNNYIAGGFSSLSAGRVVNPVLASQTIGAFSSIGDTIFRGLGHQESLFAPTSSSGLPVTLSVKSGPATISYDGLYTTLGRGYRLTITGAGTVVLAANQAGNENYSSADEVTTSFNVSKGSQTIQGFYSPGDQVLGGPYTFLLSSLTSSSGLPVTLSVKSGPATLSGNTLNTLTLTGAGTVVLAANQAGDENYNAAPEVTTSFNVSKRSQTIGAFFAISDKVFGAAPFVVTVPTPSDYLPVSGMPVTLSVKSGPATLSGNTVTLTGAGKVVLAANQAGNENYNAAPEVTTSFNVSKGSQSIADFSAISDKVFGAAPFVVAAPASSSGLPVTLSVKSGPATLSGNTVTLTGAGTVVLAANQAGNEIYNTAPEVTASFNVKATQTIGAFNSIGDVIFRGLWHQESLFAPTSSSGLPVTLSVKSGPATISHDGLYTTLGRGYRLTITGAGTVVLAANQAGNENYSPADEVTTSFNVSKGSQTIQGFYSPGDQVLGAPSNLLAGIVTSSSGLPVTLSVKSGPATLSGNTLNTLTLTGAGTVVLAANQAGDENYNAAPEVTTSFNVSKASQTIGAFSAISDKVFGAAPFVVAVGAPTSNSLLSTINSLLPASGLPVTLSVKSGPATLNGNTVTLTGVGTVVLAANQAGNENYNAAPEVTTSFNVSKASQTIGAISAISDKVFGAAPFVVAAPASSSGLPVTLSVKSGPATLSGNTLTLTGAGTVVLVANQAGNENYIAASEVTTSFNVKATQTIGAFSAISDKVFGAAPFVVTAPTSSSSLPVVLSVKSGPATISEHNTVTLTGVGDVVLAANQAGNENYSAASEVTTSFSVSKSSQTIEAFSTIDDKAFGVAPFAVTAPTSSSSLPVVLSVKSGSATISANNTVTLTGVGDVVLAANQAGNENYNAAYEVTIRFNVSKGDQIIGAFSAISNKVLGAAPFVVAAPTSSSGLPITLSVKSGPATLSGNMVTLIGTGTVVLAANQAGNENYNTASEVTGSFNVKASQTIEGFRLIGSQVLGVEPFAVAAPTSSSGLPVTISVKSGPATISANNTVTLTGSGTVVLAANQAGNATYLSAEEVTTSFIVSLPPTPTVDWKSPTDRQSSMTLYATIQDHGVMKTHPLSLLAAFDENGCTGVAGPLSPPNSNVFTVTIWSNTNTSEVFDLKFYDAETGKILYINEQIRFETDKLVGSIQSPEALTVAYEEILQKIPVVKGWNWISFSVLPLDSTVSKLLKDYTPEDNDVLKGQKGFATFFRGKWYPESYEIEAGRMYALQRQNSNAGEIAALGGAVDLRQPIKLVSGWNWLGFPMQSDNSIKDALTSLNATNNDVLKSQVDGTITFLDGKWLPENRRMFPGRGYMLRTEKAQNFSYITQAMPYGLEGPQTRQLKVLSVGAAPNWVKPEGLEHNMSVYATVKVDGKSVEAPGSLLAAFDGESIAGVASIQDGPGSTKLYQLQIWSNNSTKEGLVLKSYNSETGQTYSLAPTIKFQSDAKTGEISAPALFTYSTPTPAPVAPAPGGALASSGASQPTPAKKGKGAKKSSASKSANAKSKSDSGGSAKKSSGSSAKKSGAKKAKKK